MTTDEVWIGADSKVASINDKSLAQSVCKIMQVDDLFFAFAGLPKYNRGGYDLVAIVKKAVKSGRSLSDKVRAFDDLVVKPLERSLSWIKSHQPDYYKQEIAGKNAVQIVFAGIEKGRPLLQLRYITVTDHGGRKPSVTVNKVRCPGSDCPRGEFITFLGHNAAIKRYISKVPSFWQKGYAEGIRLLIDLEIKEAPEVVGPPIDILRIGRRGAEWIQKKAVCKEIE